MVLPMIVILPVAGLANLRNSRPESQTLLWYHVAIQRVAGIKIPTNPSVQVTFGESNADEYTN